jgi:hypothetical protein
MFIIPKVKITNVDMESFLGRDYHPEPEMIGLTGFILKVAHEVHLENETLEGKYLAAEPKIFYQCAEEQRVGKESRVITCYVVVLENGKKVELMDFEIEAVN